MIILAGQAEYIPGGGILQIDQPEGSSVESMSLTGALRQFFQSGSLQSRIAYLLLLLLALFYLVSQIGMAVLWITGQAQVDIL